MSLGVSRWSTQSGGALNGASITRLVQTGEQIITSERLAWSTMARDEDATKDKDGAAVSQQGAKPAQAAGGGGGGGGGRGGGGGQADLLTA